MPPQIESQWYAQAFDLNDMIGSSWTKNTEKDVDVVLKILDLKGDEKILDIACGFGRHSLELAKRGFQVVGVDISENLINFAKEQAKEIGLEVDFICADLRHISFKQEFDVVLNLYDGAIGYLENEEENQKIFEFIASALKPGGKHIMHTHSTEYARKYFPQRMWREADNMIELLENEWDSTTGFMVETTYSIPYGEVFQELKKPVHERKRIYGLEELQSILGSLNMKILRVFGGLEEEARPSEDYDYFSVLSIKL